MSRRKLRKLTAFGNAGANGPGSGGGISNILLTGEGDIPEIPIGLEVQIDSPNTTIRLPFIIPQVDVSTYPIEEGMTVAWGDGNEESISLDHTDIDMPLFIGFTGYEWEYPPIVNNPSNPLDLANWTGFSRSRDTQEAFSNSYYSYVRLSNGSRITKPFGGNLIRKWIFGTASNNPFLLTADATTDYNDDFRYATSASHPSIFYDRLAATAANNRDLFSGSGANNDGFDTKSWTKEFDYFYNYKKGRTDWDDWDNLYTVCYSVEHTYSQPGTYYITPTNPSVRDAGFDKTWNRVHWEGCFKNYHSANDPNTGYSFGKLWNLPPAAPHSVFLEFFNNIESSYEDYFETFKPYFIKDRLFWNEASLTENPSIDCSDLIFFYGSFYPGLNVKVKGDISNLKQISLGNVKDFDGVTAFPTALTHLSIYSLHGTSSYNLNNPNSDGETTAQQATKFTNFLNLIDTSNARNILIGAVAGFSELDLSLLDVGRCVYFDRMFASVGSYGDQQELDISSWNIGQNLTNIYTGYDILVSATTDALSDIGNQGAKPNRQVSDNGYARYYDNITMESMFENCTKPIGDITGWDTSKVYTMSYMFRGCTSIDQDLSSWDFTGLINGDRRNISDPNDAAWGSPNYLLDRKPWSFNPLFEIFSQATSITSTIASNLLVKWEADAYAKNLSEGINVAVGDTPQYLINLEMSNANTWTTVTESSLTAAGAASLAVLESVFGWEFNMIP